MKQVRFEDVTISEGYWAEKQKLVSEKTVWAVYDRFYETGRIATLECEWKEGDPCKPHHYWGSDVFKWLEGAAYLLSRKKDEKLQNAVDDTIRRIEKGVSEDGYYNSYYNSVGEPRFSDRTMHELYSLGHLIEGAIALDKYLKDGRLLKIAVQNTELVDRIFRVEDSAAFTTPGHEEIELALFMLYQYTGKKKYLTLMQYFIDMRGNNRKEKDLSEQELSETQSDEPLRQLSSARGHAVRAVYLYSAMADLAQETGDRELAEAADRMFDDIYYRKMYLTGAIGSCYQGEKFTKAYDLPNRDAYAETCASIGLALFCGRLYQQKPDGRYGDVFERAVYNGMISGLSLDGEAFFYSNPLTMDLQKNDITRTYQPKTVRQKVFRCSCCPPNLVRMIPSIGNWIYSYEEDRVYIHQFIANTANVDGTKVTVKTDYPHSGKVQIFSERKKAVVRKPAWCKAFTASAPYTEKDGYLYFETGTVELDFSMTPVFVKANSAVHADNGRAALMMGPIVYCAEGKDQQADLFSLSVDVTAPAEISAEQYGGFPKLTAKGYKTVEPDTIYYDAADAAYEETKITYVPFASFANRGEDNMTVWLPQI